MATNDLLDFRTDDPLPTIKIDGKRYALAMDLDFGELMRIGKLAKRTIELGDKDELTEQEEAELRDLAAKSVKRCLQAPAAVLAKLRDAHRLAIIGAFNDEFEKLKNPTPIGSGTSSRGSNGSTEDTPKTG